MGYNSYWLEEFRDDYPEHPTKREMAEEQQKSHRAVLDDMYMNLHSLERFVNRQRFNGSWDKRSEDAIHELEWLIQCFTRFSEKHPWTALLYYEDYLRVFKGYARTEYEREQLVHIIPKYRNYMAWHIEFP